MGQTEDAVAAELLAEIIDVRADVLLRLRAEPWSHYTVTKKRKRSGGHRTLRKPCALLKLIQRRLLRTVLRQIGQQDAAQQPFNRE